VGDELPALHLPPLTRHTLAMYCGASGDHNPIHVDIDFAKASGLPDVIAHGMLTMAEAVRVVTDWTGDPGSVMEYGVRFTRPVPVPDTDSGTTLNVTGKVTAKNDDGTVTVTLSASCDGQTVLAKSVARVRVS
jgi:acyl dehydratase